jgi:membrane-associated phospholipid phosphatase
VSRNKALIIAARIISIIFTPFYLPLVGIAILFSFSYMNMLPLSYKLLVVTIVYLLTILAPTLLIRLYRQHRGWSLLQLGHRRRRLVAYVISILCYLACIWLMFYYHIYHFIVIIVVAALIIQAVSVIVSIWWKISMHTAAIGGVAGALMAFAELFRFNPVWWLCIVVFLSGILGTARIVLRQHTLGQVVAAFFIGAVCAFFTILYL